jgi:putative transcriptional regulator
MIMSYSDMPVGEVLDEISKGLRFERLNQNLTQSALAERAGVAVDTIRSLEAGGNATLAVLVKVMRGLGLDGRLELLLPTPTASPIDVAKRDGRVRERATGSRVSTPIGPWAFADAPDGLPPVAP